MISLLTHRRRSLVPAAYRSNFSHLYLDIAWYGVLSGSAISFVSLYVVRLGATALHVGLLGAAPAVITLLFALPSARWLNKQPTDRAVFWSALFFRLFYLLWIPLPILFANATQIWLFILLSFAMSIPGTVLAVGFNALFADVVPPDWRAHVTGIRNGVLAISFTVTTLLCGYLLSILPFRTGYQIVFAIGCAGAVMSTLHLWYIRPQGRESERPRIGRSLGDLARPGFTRSLGDAFRPSTGLRFLTRRAGGLRLPRFNVLRGPFGPVLFVLFAFHLAQFLAIPLFPIYWVDRLSFSDQDISLANAIFYIFVFLGSTRLAGMTRRFGHHRVMVMGAVVMAAYPGLTSITTASDFGLFLATAVVGGLAWAMAGGAIGNYILDRVPDDDRPAHLAWYNLALHAAILIGSLGGPLFAGWVGLSPALALIGGGRLLSALAIWRWGK